MHLLAALVADSRDNVVLRRHKLRIPGLTWSCVFIGLSLQKKRNGVYGFLPDPLFGPDPVPSSVTRLTCVLWFGIKVLLKLMTSPASYNLCALEIAEQFLPHANFS